MVEEAKTSDRTTMKMTCNFKISRVVCRPRRGSAVEDGRRWVNKAELEGGVARKRIMSQLKGSQPSSSCLGLVVILNLAPKIPTRFFCTTPLSTCCSYSRLP